MLHGGVICAMLDDAMWWAVYAAYKAITVTAEIQLRYREPVSTGSAVRIEGIVGPGRRLYPAAARMIDASGRVAAEAAARFVAMPAAKTARLRF
jgi:acyl-coenzyme A thioesterase PaaI-like protein